MAIFCDPIKVRRESEQARRGDEGRGKGKGASKREKESSERHFSPSVLLRNFPELPTSYQSESEWAEQRTVQRKESQKWTHLLSYLSLVQLLIIVLKVAVPPSEPIY